MHFPEVNKLLVYCLQCLTILIGLSGCDNPDTSKTERAGEPTIYNVTSEDKEMNEAIKAANKTFIQFDTAFRSGNQNYSHFAVKLRFNTSTGFEHIWVTGIWLNGEEYSGVVSDVPFSTNEVKLGDTVQVINRNISDWMYVEDKKLRGGFTIRLLRKRMTDEERSQADKELGFIIDD